MKIFIYISPKLLRSKRGKKVEWRVLFYNIKCKMADGSVPAGSQCLLNSVLTWSVEWAAYTHSCHHAESTTNRIVG